MLRILHFQGLQSPKNPGAPRRMFELGHLGNTDFLLVTLITEGIQNSVSQRHRPGQSCQHRRPGNNSQCRRPQIFAAPQARGILPAPQAPEISQRPRPANFTAPQARKIFQRRRPGKFSSAAGPENFSGTPSPPKLGELGQISRWGAPPPRAAVGRGVCCACREN